LKVVTEPPMPLGTLRPDIPAGIGAVIERCLEKDPTKRYANAAELASALEPFVPPASRVLADRARLAMGTGSGARPAPPFGTGSTPTLQSGSGSTPGTSVPWGTDRVVTPSLPQSPQARPGALRLVVGAAAVGFAGLAGFLFLGRGPASVGSARPEAPVAVASSLPSPSPPPPVAAPPAAAAPAAVALASTAAPTPIATAQPAASSSAPALRPAAAPSAPAAQRGAPSPPANVAAILKTRPAVPSEPGKTTATDDDIPTIR
jgi:serine/threonine-protein kinase